MEPTLRGPSLYPTVAERYMDDRRIAGRTRKNHLGLLARFQRRLDRDNQAIVDANNAVLAERIKAGAKRRPRAKVDPRRFTEITPADVKDFVLTNEDGLPRSDRAAGTALGLIWQVFDWAADPELGIPLPLNPNPATRLRAERRRERKAPRDVARRTWLERSRVDELIAHTLGDGRDEVDRYDAFIIAFYVSTGLRVSELLSIRWCDVDLGSGKHGMVYAFRKNNQRSRTPVALLPMSRRVLLEWKADFEAHVDGDISQLSIIPRVVVCPLGPWERHADGRGVKLREVVRVKKLAWTVPVTTPETLRRRIDVRAKAFGIDHLRPHDLRRTFAGILEDNKTDLRVIQGLLNHKSLGTTERYLQQRTRISTEAEAAFA